MHETIRKWATTGSNLRDLALVVGAETYALGYLVWAVFAWWSDLGALPGWEALYFATGAVTNAFVGGVWWMSHRLRVRLLPDIQGWVNESATDKRHRIVVFCGIGISAGAYLAMVALMELVDPKTLGRWSGMAVIAVMVTLMVVVAAAVALVVAIEWSPQRRRPRPLWWRAAPYVFIPMIGVLLLSISLLVLYHVVPPSLGGGRPLCASLDIVPAKLSSETLTALGIDPAVSRAQVVRSRPLRIHFDGQARIVAAGVDSRAFIEIAGDAVAAKVRCDCEDLRATPAPATARAAAP